MAAIDVFLYAASVIGRLSTCEAFLDILRVQVTRSDAIVNLLLLLLAQRPKFGSRIGCFRSFLPSVLRTKSQ
jgi:hypothetical protein